MIDARPAVSVCIPTRNRSHYLRRAISSVLDQTYRDIEVVVVDNASTDDTPHVVGNLRDHRLRYYRNDRNLGMTRNWNRCLELARGRYVALLCDDDRWLPDILEREVCVARDFPSVGLVFCKASLVDEHGNVLGEQGPPESTDYVRHGEEEFARLVLGNYIPLSTVLVVRDCYESVGAFDEALHAWADWKMWLAISLRYDIGFVSTPLALVTVHDKSGTSRVWRENMAGMEGYMLLKGLFADILPEKAHLRHLESAAIRRLAQDQMVSAIAHFCGGDSKLARRNIGLAFAIDPSVLRKPSSYIVLLLTLLGNHVGRLVGKLVQPLRRNHRAADRVRSLIARF